MSKTRYELPAGYYLNDPTGLSTFVVICHETAKGQVYGSLFRDKAEAFAAAMQKPDAGVVDGLRPHNVSSDVMFYAFRYALGRMTLATFVMVGNLISDWHLIDLNHQRLIIKEIKEAKERGSLGMDCDIEMWQKLLDHAAARPIPAAEPAGATRPIGPNVTSEKTE